MQTSNKPFNLSIQVKRRLVQLLRDDGPQDTDEIAAAAGTLFYYFTIVNVVIHATFYILNFHTMKRGISVAVA